MKIRGAIEGRHGVSCNGYAVPMHKTGVCGEMVAGVRYRSWQPAQCLHPTIAPHGPLVFDLYDTRTKRSLGGCTYHISDPGGQNAEDFPVNSEAAESRRRSRFWDFGHTPGAFDMGPALVDSEFPHTLDLRKVYGNN